MGRTPEWSERMDAQELLMGRRTGAARSRPQSDRLVYLAGSTSAWNVSWRDRSSMLGTLAGEPRR
jgi:hypothetical protein